MNIKFVDLQRQYESIREEVHERFERVFAKTAFILGPEAKEFEERFAEFCSTEHCIAVANGTDALVLALRALEIGAGDEVIVPVNTFIATSEAVRLVGATPVFVDPDEHTYLMHPGNIEAAITSRTKAIIPVHLYGQTVDMDPILEVAGKHGLRVIEDAAQAQGASNRGRRAGSMGDIGCFSFYPGKNLGAYGDAGAIVTSDAGLDEKLRMIRDHGSVKKYFHHVDGHNSRMDGFQAAVLNVKLNYIDGWNERRREIASQYIDRLSDIDKIVLPVAEDFNEHIWHLFVVRVANREEIQKKLDDAGIASGIHYPIPLHEQPVYKELGYAPEDFPIAHSQGPLLLSLPMFPELTDEECTYVCDVLTEAVGS